MELFNVTYTERMSFGQYDKDNIIGYLNETVIENYVPEHQGEEEPQPCTGYQYTGPMKDGGTLMPCKDASNYGEVVNAIIRVSISESEELAIHRHRQNDAQAYEDEWARYNGICEAAKETARRWLGME